MTGLILKLSYNYIGDSNVVGGICGSFFFLQQDKAITANHVLNRAQFKPNEGFALCQFWLISQTDFIVEIKADNLTEYSEVDTTIIELEHPYKNKIRKISLNDFQVGTRCENEGFIAGEMPDLDISWASSGLIISGCNYNVTSVVERGHIKSLTIITILANDINLNNIKGFETSYGGIIGMSGGPLIATETDEIIGLMSIGLPADAKVKKTLFAISLIEIMSKV
jgi:hypothetical protein